MRLTTESEFKAHCKNEKPASVYLFCGEETYLKQRCVQLLLKKAVPKAQADFNLHRFEGSAKVDDIADAVQAIPIFGEYVCVLVTDPDLEKLSAKSVEKWKELLETIPENSILILQFLSSSFNCKKNAACKTVAQLVQDRGVLCEFEPLRGVQLLSFVRALAQKEHVTLSTQTAQLLIDRFGEDAQGLTLEVAKLCSYVKEGEITPEIIERCTPARPDSSSFDLARSILSGNYSGALEQLEELFAQREAPEAIIGALSMSFIDLYRAGLARANSVPSSQISADFGYKGREFRIRNAIRDSYHYSQDYLDGALSLLLQADRKCKTQRVDEQVLLQRLVTELFALRKK